MVQPAREVDDVVNGVDKEEDLTHRPACEESAADHQ